jgi:long-chain acyl-CoA synthetase
MIYPNGSAKIIDRSKNIFKLSQGEYITPEKLENIFSLSPYIANSFIYGDSLRSCTVAIFVPETDKVKQWAQENGKCQNLMHNLGKNTGDLEAAAKDPVFKKLVMDDLLRLATENKLSGLEKPKDFDFSFEPFSIENNIITPTLKLKRNIAREVFKSQIDAMYSKLAKQGL